MARSESPFYFLPKDDLSIEEYRLVFDSLKYTEKKRLYFDVNPDIVETKQVAMIQKMVLALQHYPKLMHEFLFSIEFKFTQIADSTLYFQNPEWKSNPIYRRWFHAMMNFPAIPFFLRDPDARFFAYVGDLLADGKFETGKPDKSGRGTLTFNSDQVRIFSDRMFQSCHVLHLYFHGSGYDPKDDIEGMIAYYDLPVEYESIKVAYKKDVKEGIKFKVIPGTLL